MKSDEHNELLEQLLNAGLQRYSDVEPRPGLEGRISANLRSEHAHSPFPVWLKLATVAALLLIAGGTFLAVRSRRSAAPVVAGHIETHHPAPATGGLSEEPSPPSVMRSSNVVANTRRPASTASVRRDKKHSQPKLERFPSSSPLNEQEELLARYVRERPGEAILLARARAELRKQDLARFTEAAESGNPDKDMQQ